MGSLTLLSVQRSEEGRERLAGDRKRLMINFDRLGLSESVISTGDDRELFGGRGQCGEQFV